MTTTIRKNRNGYNYSYTDIAAVNQYIESTGQSYYQEIETVDGEDYIVTHCLDASGKTIRTCRGCRIVKVSGKNPAQDYGSALTYARRYSLLMAYGLATADDAGAAFNPVKPKVTKTDRKPVDKTTCKVETLDRQAGMDTIKRLLDDGVLDLLEIQNEVRKHGFTKMQDLPPDAFRACIATLTGRV